MSDVLCLGSAWTAGLDRLDLPVHAWLIETNTAVVSACLAQDQCATTFNGALGMAATFNRTVWELKGRVLSTELRALNNIAWTRGSQVDHPISLTGYGPNINLVRDPRWGRIAETAGEDPTLSGLYAKHFIHGLTEKDSQGHPRMIPYLKHFTGYNVETDRMTDNNFKVSDFDMYDTYLRQFEIAFTQSDAAGIQLILSLSLFLSFFLSRLVESFFRKDV